MSDVTEQKVEYLVTSVLGSNVLSSLTVAAVLGLAGGVGWLIRRVFTNQKQVEELRSALQVRDKQRDEDREDLKEVKVGVHTLTSTVDRFIAKQEAKDEFNKDR